MLICLSPWTAISARTKLKFFVMGTTAHCPPIHSVLLAISNVHYTPPVDNLFYFVFIYYNNSSFEETEEVQNMFTLAGLTEIQNLVDRRLQVNRKKKVKMQRVWVQGKFQKPLLLSLNNPEETTKRHPYG